MFVRPCLRPANCDCYPRQTSILKRVPKRNFAGSTIRKLRPRRSPFITLDNKTNSPAQVKQWEGKCQEQVLIIVKDLLDFAR
ncbi:hypothetical protein J6590_035415 [Homalodisca vitripennis]|nr:hypothetical protein J6590_035415 [Homalodisca vitripennis]